MCKMTALQERLFAAVAVVLLLAGLSSAQVAMGQEKEERLPVTSASCVATNSLTIRNCGRCGQNSGITREKFAADVLALTPKPDYVLIYIGMNDVINDKFFTPLDAYIENMTWMIEQARKAGIKPVICTMHHVIEAELYKHHSRDKFGAETVNGKMDRYNIALRKLAAEQRVALADFNAVTDRLPPSDFLSEDGVHLTPAGNRLLAKTFFDVLAPCLRGQETIICVGDSLTYGYQNKGAGTSEGETYPAMLRTFAANTPVPTAVIPLDGSGWHLAIDPNNVGLDQKWCEKPSGEARLVKCPSIIQDAFPGYHGVAWYWREFMPPANPHTEGRYLLRFWQVDYLADVWVNGIRVGQHEGGEVPFVLDITDTVKPGAPNLLAVRVLNPTREPIDGISLAETPHRNKAYPPTAGCDYNYGGITDATELLLTPPVRIENLFVRPDPKTGRIRVQANLRNAGKATVTGKAGFAVSPAAGGETLAIVTLDRDLPSGDTLVETELTVQNPQLWELNQPTLYRVSAQVSTSASASIDQQSTRCGFRDFRFEDGTFQLNGKRLFLKCSHSGCELPCIRVAVDPDFLRKDLLNCKVMGFNAIRFIAGIPPRMQLELCDEIGLMVYEECFAAWCLGDSPKMAERFDRATQAMILRDRNHPSIVMWGLLNETKDGAVFRHALNALPLVRAVDDTRLVMLGSGRWDKAPVGSLANPETNVWQDVLDDQHPYQGVPHTASVIQKLRTLGRESHPMFISENGTGSALDLPRLARQFEQWQKTASEDAVYYRDKLDRFMADWTRWNLSDTFANPEDYFRQCLAQMASLRRSEINAIRANPNVVAYSLTGTQDQGLSGEGLTTLFRELKPGTIDAMFDALYPLRWCLFVEPVQVCRGQNVRLEAVLANEDKLVPGDYPVRFQVVGPHAVPVFDRTVTVNIPDPKSKPAPKFALPVFSGDVLIDGPPGRYRFLATFLRGGAAAGGDFGFYVSDPAEMPKVKAEIVRWGDDPELSKWLAAHDIKTRDFVAGERHSAREVILVGTRPAPGGGKAFRELAEHIARGSQVVFLSFDVFKKDDKNQTCWLPLASKGAVTQLPAWLYHKDDWAKNHPLFEGLPAGGILDTTFYREIISNSGFSGQEVPSEVVAGMIDASSKYGSALTLGIYKLGAGRFFLNTLRIRENLPSHPVAERLLLNMLRYAAHQATLPIAEMPADFGQQLDAFGYN